METVHMHAPSRQRNLFPLVSLECLLMQSGRFYVVVVAYLFMSFLSNASRLLGFHPELLFDFSLWSGNVALLHTAWPHCSADVPLALDPQFRGMFSTEHLEYL